MSFDEEVFLAFGSLIASDLEPDASAGGGETKRNRGCLSAGRIIDRATGAILLHAAPQASSVEV